MPQPILNARAMKVTVVLDPVEVAQLVAPDGQPRVGRSRFAGRSL